MKITAEPRSDQINAEDLIAGPRVFTIAGVKSGKATQKYDIDLVESPGRCWRPPLTMLRVLLKAWGDDSGTWVGRRVRLFTDPTVTFGSTTPGGIRISHLSNIDKQLSLALTVKRGSRALYTVDPLIEAAPVPQRDWHAEAVACVSEDALRALYMDAQAANASSEVLSGIQGMAAQFAAPQAPESPSEPVEQ